MRSTCRCSCVLQFTCRRAFCGVLHRPTCQVIHRSGLWLRFASSAQEPERRARSAHPCRRRGFLLREGEATSRRTRAEPTSARRPSDSPRAVRVVRWADTKFWFSVGRPPAGRGLARQTFAWRTHLKPGAPDARAPRVSGGPAPRWCPLTGTTTTAERHTPAADGASSFGRARPPPTHRRATCTVRAVKLSR